MSMFLDQVTIDVKAGKGGDGMVAFRREKYVPDGGPAGGDGGHGGAVILVVDEGLRTLMDFRFNRHFKAQPGENGRSKGMHGRGSEDTYVKVPQGTTVRDAETGALLGDLIENGQTLVVAKVAAAVAEISDLLHQKIQHLKLPKMANQDKKEKSN